MLIFTIIRHFGDMQEFQVYVTVFEKHPNDIPK